MLLSEWLVCLYVAAIWLLMTSGGRGTITRVFGWAVLLGFLIEVVLFRKWKPTYKIIPCLPLVILVLQMGIWELLFDGTTAKALSYFQLAGTILVVFALVNYTRRITSVGVGFCLATMVLALCWLIPSLSDRFYFLDPVTGRVVFGFTNDVMNQNVLGAYYNIAILVIGGIIMVDPPRIRSIWYRRIVQLILAATMGFACYQVLIVIGSRQNQAWFGITLGGLIFIQRFSSKSRRFLITLFLYLCAAIAFWYAMQSGVFARWEPASIDKDLSVVTRTSLAELGFQMFRMKPMLGWGPDGFLNNSGHGMYSHNQFIELAVNYGLIGIALFISYYFLLMRRALQLLIRKDNLIKKHAGWYIVAIIGLLASHMTRPIIDDKIVFIFLSALGGRMSGEKDVI